MHVGHDTVIGKKCLIASQTGIAGCVIIEDEVTIWGQVGTNSGITIGKGAVILGQTGVTKSVEGGKSYFGTPVSESREKLKEMAEIKRFLKDKKTSNLCRKSFFDNNQKTIFAVKTIEFQLNI